MISSLRYFEIEYGILPNSVFQRDGNVPNQPGRGASLPYVHVAGHYPSYVSSWRFLSLSLGEWCSGSDLANLDPHWNPGV
jgi:hypothetical protein